jgi:2-dehydro-3-deoxygluconokinase
MSQPDAGGPPQLAPEVICVGESMAMVAPARPEPLRTAQAFTIRAAGAESNVATYLSALGHAAAWAGRVGDDPLGDRLLDELGRARVDLSLVERDSAAPTGVYFKDPSPAGTRVYYYRGTSAAAAMTEDVINRIAVLRPRVVHISGIVPALSDSCARVTRAVVVDRRLGDVLISFDVNFRRALWHRELAGGVLRDLAQAADIVFVGLDEARELWGLGAAADVRELLNRPARLLVKDGSSEATEYGEGAPITVPALKVRTVEPVGAGDAFAAGWLSGYLRGLTAAQRIRLGHLLAANTMRSMADFEPVPSAGVLARVLAITDAEWLEWSPGSRPTAGEADHDAVVAVK